MARPPTEYVAVSKKVAAEAAEALRDQAADLDDASLMQMADELRAIIEQE